MSNERKLKRAAARAYGRIKDWQRRRHLGCKKNTAEPLTRAEFERRFPHLPIAIWYAKKSCIGDGHNYDY